jgi:CHAT domain-containing protein
VLNSSRNAFVIPLVGSFVLSSVFGQITPPSTLLQEADRLADLYNWSDAGPRYEQAGQGFSANGQLRNALYARVGHLRSTMESSSLPQLAEYLEDELAKRVVQEDRELKLRFLTVKGDVDGEIDTAAAVVDWNEVLAMATAAADRKLTARAGGELAILAFLQGRLQDARPMMAKAILEAKALHDVGAEIRYLSASGTGLVLLRSYAESLQFFDQAMALASANPDTGFPFTLYWGKAKALMGLNRLSEAQALVDVALQEARDRNKRVKEAQFLITAAAISESTRRQDRSIMLLESAAELARQGGFRRLLETAYVDLADIYRARKDLPNAERYASAGVDAARSSGETYLIPFRLTGLAALKTSLKKYAEADALYAEAADVIEGMLLNAPDARTQVGLLTTMSDTYAEHFALAATEMYDVEKAFSIVEQVRGRSLNDLLRGGGPGRWTNEAAPAQEREIRRLRLRLVNAGNARERKQALQALFFANQTRLLSVTTLADPPRIDEEDISLARIRAKLRPDEVLLEYVLRDPTSYCLVATRENARIVQLPGRSELEKSIEAGLKSLQARDAAPPEASRVLFTKLLGNIPDVQSKSRMIVVPDGKLHLVPFGSLINPAGQFLVASHVITYAPSGTSLYLLGRERRTQPQMRTFLGIGGVEYGPDREPTRPPATLVASARRAVGLYGTSFGTLSPLPGSEDEVRSVSAILGGGTTLIGSAATKAAFRAEPLNRYRVIHLSTHAIADPKQPDHAALILRDDPSANQDGYLEPSEVARLRLNADLVTLSACETAVGRLQGQEGVANLTRAFLYSGAKTVVSTLWRIDDNYSLYLMKRFYQHLAEGKPKADSLTFAQRDLIAHFGPKTTPYYWAAFVLVGEPNARLRLAGIQRKASQ